MRRDGGRWMSISAVTLTDRQTGGDSIRESRRYLAFFTLTSFVIPYIYMCNHV